ncbi:MAG TPA: FtsQ-type POTRA domain-containing protein [Kofleriaceae bacterium]|nr:FtsQ-type POTRA domain-containing protein [Kofleriaceae bacterium]
MDRSRSTNAPAPPPAAARVPRSSRIVLRPNKRRPSPFITRLPRPRAVVEACGRALRRSAPSMLALVAVGAVGGGVWGVHRWATTSPRFAVATIAVHGSHVLTDDQVRDLLPFHAGDNVFSVDTDAAERVLAAEPWVARARVRRHLPRSVTVEIVERTPAAVVSADGLYLVDAAGRPFKRAELDRGEGEGLPVISGVPRPLFTSAPDEAADRIKHALEVVGAWSDAGAGDGAARPAIGEVRVDQHGATLYTFDDAVAVRVGDAAGPELATRLRRFDAAWAALSPDERRRARAVHVESDTRSDLVTVSFANP